TNDKAQSAIDFANQAEHLGQYTASQETEETGSTQAVEARFITPQDPVVQTANGGRLPTVPIEEALKLNQLRDSLEEEEEDHPERVDSARSPEGKDVKHDQHGARPSQESSTRSTDPSAPLREAVPPSRTNPLFPPLPLYGPPSPLRNLQALSFRISSFFLSLLFLYIIVLGAAFTSIPLALRWLWMRLTFRNPAATRPFYQEEQRRAKRRKEESQNWKRHHKRPSKSPLSDDKEDSFGGRGEDFVPLEGGHDRLLCDVRYYARRVGLECEEYAVQTEDGFIIELWHLYNPRDYKPVPESDREPHGPEVFSSPQNPSGTPGPHFPELHFPNALQYPDGQKKYPVLLMHGLLQSGGAFCASDDESLAFYLAKSGYDIWLGNNRCGFKPRHTLLEPKDPRMWAWNIRQMGVLDLPALVSRVLSETGFSKVALVAHSQGTTQAMVALAKEQRPDIGSKISVFCALAPAAYAGPLIGKAYFKFMRIISPDVFRAIFGIHSFIPFMLDMHKILPGRLYGYLGYRVFSFLFSWSDARWERALRDRMFQFSPVYVSAESMRWWLGRDCFAKQKCILATREEGMVEDEEDKEEEEMEKFYSKDAQHSTESWPDNGKDRGRFAWYDERAPPMAFWVAGSDDLVDGRRLLRRFHRKREPHVQVVHEKVIESYEHLDVIWAVDSIEQVGKEVKEVIWKTVPNDDREMCRIPSGCEKVK
ncbi:alpha/beta-hydrolase, partial [Viridothelium virens]